MSSRPEDRTIEVPVAGGMLRVGVSGADEPDAPTALLVHGITSSHLAWDFVVTRMQQLRPDARLIAPDLRGRGGSRTLRGSAGLVAHAADLRAVLDHLGVQRTLVVGHSMGGFVAVVFAHLYPERVSRLLLVDGGLPLDVAPGLDVEAVIAGVLGPTAARLAMRFHSIEEYLDFWSTHPAFVGRRSPTLDEYFAYDLVDDGDGALRPATAYETVMEDVTDMNHGSAHPAALASLGHPTRLLTVPRGLQNEEPGMYSSAYLERVLSENPRVRHERVSGFNHYDIVMSDPGANVVATALVEELDAV